jgi:hypothetical protein
MHLTDLFVGRLGRRAVGFVVASIAVVWSAHDPLRAEDEVDAGLRGALSFHASFDGGVTADFARGDRALYHAPSHDKREAPEPGLPPTGEVVLAEAAGRAGRALHFLKTKAPVVLFKAEKNFPAPKPDWSATLSCWLSVDPAADLAPGFCDPIQVTSKKWDDAAIFLEFEKRAEGIPFRLGVYADTAVWNPQGKKWEDIPAAEKPLVTVAEPPFGKGRWTHVALVVERFNTGQGDGSARLYLDGREAGRIGPRPQTFTWDMDRAAIMLGIGYAGFMDDLAVFDRALSDTEVSRLHALGTGVAVLHPKP